MEWSETGTQTRGGSEWTTKTPGSRSKPCLAKEEAVAGCQTEVRKDASGKKGSSLKLYKKKEGEGGGEKAKSRIACRTNMRSY